MAQDLTQQLRQSVEGLLYSSETDAPFEVVRLDKSVSKLSGGELAALVGRPADCPVEEVAFEDFFGDLTQDQDWHDSDDKKTVERYRNLQAVLQRNLADIKVFKVGQVQLDVYIVGRTPDNTWVGVKTKAVET